MNLSTTIATISTTLDPFLHNISCDVPHDDQSKIYTYRLTSSFVGFSTFVAVLNFLLILPTALMNLFIVLGLAKQRDLMTNPNKLLVSICGADFIIGAFVEPIFGAHIIQVTKASHNCDLSNVLIYMVPVMILVTMVTHAVIAIERYFAIHHPNTYPSIFSSCFVTSFTIFIWVVCFLCFIIPLITGKVIIGNSITVCLILVSLAICSYCYISMYQDFTQRHVKTTAKIKGAYVIREQTEVVRSADEQAEFKSNVKTASFFSKLFLCMLIIYVLVLVKNVLNAYDVFPGNGYYTMHFLFDTVLFMNAFINPILIFYLSPEIYSAATMVLS